MSESADDRAIKVIEMAIDKAEADWWRACTTSIPRSQFIARAAYAAYQSFVQATLDSVEVETRERN